MIVSKKRFDALQARFDTLSLQRSQLEAALQGSRDLVTIIEGERDLWKQKHDDLNEYSDKELSNTALAAGQKVLAAAIDRQSDFLKDIYAGITEISAHVQNPKKKKAAAKKKKSK